MSVVVSVLLEGTSPKRVGMRFAARCSSYRPLREGAFVALPPVSRTGQRLPEMRLDPINLTEGGCVGEDQSTVYIYDEDVSSGESSSAVVVEA